MIRYFVMAALLLTGGVTAAPAKEWAQKMFQVTSHEFGNVARGSKSEFAFEITNMYEEDVHIADVRTSCGCTIPTITKPTLKTWEKGSVIAALNTRSFTGQRAATLTVVIDKPYYAEVQLTVNGYIHGDVDFQPGSVVFGEVDQGAVAAKEVMVTHAGASNWQVTDVRSANSNLEVELSDPIRSFSKISYKMLVRLKPGAPAGGIHDTLTLVTNDPRMPTVPISVEGRVVPPLQVSPSSLFVGILAPGETATKQLVVRGKTPFRIVDIRCPDGAFHFKVTDQARPVHLIPVTFTAPETPGEVNVNIEIETDLPSGGTTTCIARGTIKAPASQEPNVAAKSASLR